ncbi:unnamed protein product, partial [Ceratitis capitata]
MATLGSNQSAFKSLWLTNIQRIGTTIRMFIRSLVIKSDKKISFGGVTYCIISLLDRTVVHEREALR